MRRMFIYKQRLMNNKTISSQRHNGVGYKKVMKQRGSQKRGDVSKCDNRPTGVPSAINTLKEIIPMNNSKTYRSQTAKPVAISRMVRQNPRPNWRNDYWKLLCASSLWCSQRHIPAAGDLFHHEMGVDRVMALLIGNNHVIDSAFKPTAGNI